jgi:chorismate lyase / 3-hydroxybenzoate synthase
MRIFVRRLNFAVMTTPAPDMQAATAALLLDYLPRDQLESQPSSWWRQVLGVVGFAALPRAAAAVPLSATLTPQLSPSAPLCEVWRVAEDAPLSETITRGLVRYRYSDELLFGCLQIAEAGIDSRSADALMDATETAYQELFGVLGESQHRHLVRIWNYLPQINAEAGGEERYRRFNAARQSAFRNSGRAAMGTVPAACALGSPAGSPLSVYFLAARRPARMIENPRQTSAYHYPPKFGRHSPLFSRACLFGNGGTSLFISGTASIVGHETIHSGDVVAQTLETLANIEALLGEANRVAGVARYRLADLNLKVYVRNPADLCAIQQVLEKAIGAAQPVYLKADVCRDDLLVEIEATG